MRFNLQLITLLLAGVPDGERPHSKKPLPAARVAPSFVSDAGVQMTIEARDLNGDGQIDLEVTSIWSDAGTLETAEHYRFPADGGHATSLTRLTQLTPKTQHIEQWEWHDGTWEELEAFDTSMTCVHRDLP